MNNPEQKTTAIGKRMSLIAWIIGMVLATQFFADWEEKQLFPNQNPEATISNSEATVRLKQNRSGHYITSGKINGKPVTFLLDTGATDVVIPANLAKRLDLPKIGRSLATTANGTVEVFGTVIESLQFGSINLRGVRASINPGMSGNQEILLGMSALKYLNFRQENRELIITQKR